MKITAQAPTRIGIIGGGTDVNPFAYDYGGKILSMAINLIHTVILEPQQADEIVITALGEVRSFKLHDQLPYGDDKKFDLLRAVLNYFRHQLPSGFTLSINFSGLSTSGLGTSASVAVAAIGALNAWLSLGMSRYEIVMLAWQLENNELGWVTGKQDQLAAAYGGINLLFFGPGERIGIEPLSLSPECIAKLRDWSLLLFLNSTRHSGDNQAKLVKEMTHFEKQRALFSLRDSVDEALKAVKSGELIQLGKVLDEVWERKKASHPAASNMTIDRIYSLAINNGALGGKAMGAGGGGHMYFLCPPDKQPMVKEALAQEEVSFIDFAVDTHGLQISKEV